MVEAGPGPPGRRSEAGLGRHWVVLEMDGRCESCAARWTGWDVLEPLPSGPCFHENERKQDTYFLGGERIQGEKVNLSLQI